jgi:WD40 repeat protein
LGHSQYDATHPAESLRYRFYGWTMTPAGPEYAWHHDVPRNSHVYSIAPAGPDRFAVAEAIAPAGPALSSPTWRIQVTLRRHSDGEPEVALAFPHRDQPIQQVLVSPDGSQVVVRLGTGLWVWDASDWGKSPKVIEGKTKNAMAPPAAAFHPSGRYLLLANEGPSVIVYDTTTWKQARKWKWDVGVLRTAAVAPDGSLAAAAGWLGSIVLWDLDL